MNNVKRCSWCGHNELLISYHDSEWCTVQVHDDKKLFEFMTLEMMQCGLSWLTVLKKREAMKDAFDGFDPQIIAEYGDEKIESLLLNEGIIRSKGKLQAMVNNARCFLRIAREYGSFDSWLWSMAWEDTPRGCAGGAPMPAETELSRYISGELRKRGFKYMGPVVTYSFMQAIGMTDDHEEGCFLAGIL